MNKKLKILATVIAIVLVTSLLGVGIGAIIKDSKTEKLVIYNWADYIEPEVLDLFSEYYE